MFENAAQAPPTQLPEVIEASTPGERLKLARITKKLRQTEVAKHLGTTASRVSEWEANRYLPNPRTLEQLATLYGTTSRWVLTGERSVAENITEYVSRGTSDAGPGSHAFGSALEEAVYEQLLQRGFMVHRRPIVTSPAGGPRIALDFLVEDPATGRRWYVETKSGSGPHIDSAQRMLAMVEGLTGIPTVLLTEPVLPDPLPDSRDARASALFKRPDVVAPRELRVMALRFEAEAMEMGADDADMDHVREVLRSAAESTMGARGHQEVDTAEAREEMELHMAMLREWLRGRLERRKQGGRRS